MVKVQSSAKKKRLGAAIKRTKWAPIWVIPKALGKGKKVHPSKLTVIKRHWRRTKLKA
ncbi:MAG: 50S ribosomal protein L39e [Candidatus Nanoarchaeia archaeon]